MNMNMEGGALNRLMRDEKSRHGRSVNRFFVEKIKKQWDALRPEDRNKKGEILENSNFEHFSDIYSEDERKADRAEIIRLKSLFQPKGPLGVISEAILMEGVYQLQWLAPEVEVLPTNEYDDIKNGIDVVLRFESEKEKYLYLGVDVTTWTSAFDIEEKRRKILKFLQGGKLGRLKYFEDEIAGIKGSLELPRVAIAFNPDDVIRMQDIMVKLKNHESLTEGEQIELATVRKAIESEVYNQIKSIIDYLGELKKQELEKMLGNPSPKTRAFDKFMVEYRDLLAKIKKETLM